MTCQGASGIKPMVISNQWSIWKTSNLERAQKVKALVLDDSWWARVQFVLDFTKPIMTMLRFADTNAPCLGDVYDGMDTMVEKVRVSIQQHENEPTKCEALCNKVEEIIHRRWEKMTTPLHLLACLISEVASSFDVERNWSTYSYIHLVKRNRLGSKKDEDLVYIHTNLHILSRNKNEYKEGSTKLWDVASECTNLDAMLHDLIKIIDDGDDTMTHGASSINGTVLGSNYLERAAVGDDENVDFLENPYDYESD